METSHLSSFHKSTKSPNSMYQILRPDLMLRVSELLIEDDPKAILPLLLTSKGIYTLLKTYERSVSRSVFLQGQTTLPKNSARLPEMLSTYIWPGVFEVDRYTYPWLMEVACRESTINYLLTSKLTDMSTPTGNWPCLDTSKDELKRRQAAFKRRALLLLYRLSDCAVKLTKTRDIREAQSDFLENSSVTDLAAIGCIVEIMGQGYFSIMKYTLILLDMQDTLLGIRPAKLPRELFIPKSAPPISTHADNDFWIRECMCVFEDRIQRYGPFFAWGFFEGHTSHHRPDHWTREDLQEGIDDMNAFELGYTMSYASLQSVVWKVFCNKMQCSRADSWSEAKRLVEMEMAEYKFD